MFSDRIILNQKEFDSLIIGIDYYKTSYKNGFIYKEFQTDKVLGYYDKGKDCYYIEAPQTT